MRVVLNLPDQPATDALTYVTEEGQRASVEIEAGAAILYVNRAACRFLSGLFAQLAEGAFSPGFHVHFGEDLDSEKSPESLRIVLECDP